MKIIVSPGSVVAGNPFFGRFITEMEALGHTMVAPGLGHLGSADVFHVHFPEHKVSVNKNFFRALATASAMLGFMFALRLRGRPVIWMVHEVSPLQGYHPRLHRLYMNLVRAAVSGYIFLSNSSRKEFERLNPTQRSKPMIDIFHPPYPAKFATAKEKAATRNKLGITPDEFVVGYLGDIRPYKNPEILAHMPEKLDDGRSVVPLIAGKPNEDTKDYKKFIASPRHILLDQRLSDEELASLIQTVDMVLLPYRRIWNSGFLFLVLSCRQKCVTSNLPVFKEMQGIFGDKWVTMFDLADPDQKNAVGKALSHAAKITCGDAETERLETIMKEASFDRLALNVQAFYLTFK